MASNKERTYTPCLWNSIVSLCGGVVRLHTLRASVNNPVDEDEPTPSTNHVSGGKFHLNVRVQIPAFGACEAYSQVFFLLGRFKPVGSIVEFVRNHESNRFDDEHVVLVGYKIPRRFFERDYFLISNGMKVAPLDR